MIGLSSAVLLGLSGPASAAEIAPLNLSPVAVRGGIVAIPLKLPAEGEGLPATVQVAVSDPGGAEAGGSQQSVSVLGLVIYLATPAVRPQPHWTRSANPTVLRTLPDDADPRTLLTNHPGGELRTIDGALLLVDVPESVSDQTTLRLGSETIRPVWLEPGPRLSAAELPDLIDPEASAPWRDDRPDPESPFEWFRWTLLARQDRERIPAPPGDVASQLFAKHVAELWAAGLARVATRSQGVADSLRDWLTATVAWSGTDGGESDPRRLDAKEALAMWIAEPAELGSLLGILLDTGRDDEAIMQAALAWMDARTPLTVWVESDLAGRVTLVMANPLTEELVVTMQWLGERLPPLATLLPFRSISRARVDRPVVAVGLGGAAEPIVLALQADKSAKRLAFAPRIVQAKPPSLAFGTFVPAMTLADVQAGRLGTAPPEWATGATLRRREGHWEIFAECLTPTPSDAPGALEDSLTIEVRDRTIVVRRDGRVDADADAIIDAGVRNFPDRWRARVAIPDSWMPQPGAVGAVITMGMRRETPVVRSTAVLARTSFRNETPLVEIDVSEWNDGITPR